MQRSVRFAVLNCALALAAAVPAAAQAPNVVADLVADVAETEKKFMGLANAIPADKWDWRPGAGVRSVGEVLKHVAADNYLIPAGLGHTPDAATGIKGDDYKTAVAYEARKMDKAQTIAELQKSFAFLKKSMEATSPAKLGDPVKLFGSPFTMQRAWILGTTHLHEHLGQLIAYARSNNVKPPWSQ
jgi:uncharacterized damage-inducible protein DinB